MRVGFVGLREGSGAPIARSIAACGWPLVVARDDPTSLDAMGGTDLTVVDSTAELARTCEVVVLRDVDSDGEVEALLEVLFANAAPDTIIVNNRPSGRGQARPSEVRRWAERGRAVGVFLLDAPASAPAPDPDPQPWLSLIVGGDRKAFDRCLPVLEAIAVAVCYMGGPGMGELGKIFTSLVFNANLMVAAGMLELGEQLGFDMPGLLELAQASSATSYALDQLVGREMDRGAARDVYLKMFRIRLASLSADAREMGIEPSLLEEWARSGIEMLPGAMDRIAALPQP